MEIKKDWYKNGKHFEGEVAFVNHVVGDSDYFTSYRSVLSFQVERFHLKSYGGLFGFWFDVDKEEGINLNFNILGFSVGLGLFSIYIEGKEG